MRNFLQDLVLERRWRCSSGDANERWIVKSEWEPWSEGCEVRERVDNLALDFQVLNSWPPHCPFIGGRGIEVVRVWREGQDSRLCQPDSTSGEVRWTLPLRNILLPKGWELCLSPAETQEQRVPQDSEPDGLLLFWWRPAWSKGTFLPLFKNQKLMMWSSAKVGQEKKNPGLVSSRQDANDAL